jgi:DNA modification methylase
MIDNNHIDLLPLQSADIELTSTGLILRTGLPYEQWEAVGIALQQIERTIQFALGDWLNYGDVTYGEKYAQAIEQTEHSYQALRDCAYVANNVKLSRRRDNLSFTHHREVAPLEPELQSEYLNWAISEGATVKELRQKIRQDRLSITEPMLDENTPHYAVEYGQVWKCGRHTVYCGNSYELLDIIDGDAIITDPPYGIDYQPDWKKWDGKPSDYHAIAGDHEEFNPTPFLSYETVVLFGANYFSNRLPLGGWLCWDKRTKPELDSMFGSPFELAWYKSPTTNKKSIMVRVQHGGVVNADSDIGNNVKRFHPTQKPVRVMMEIIDTLVLYSDIVIDPFAGSGSTLLACERLDRECIAIELDTDYIDIILRRWQKMTGEEPCLVSQE